jgi:hypothetical protein
MFASVTTALDGEIYGVRRPVPALLEFVRLPVGSEQVLARVTLATSHVMHPHLAVVGGVMVVVCYTGHNDRAVLVNDRGTILDTGLVVSAGDAVAIRPSPVAPAAVEVVIALAGGTHYCIAAADARLDRVDIGAPAPIPVPEGLTSGGIHDWKDAILWTDAVPPGALTSNRFQTVDGRPLVYPVTRGPWTLGQDGAPRVERVVGFDGAVWRLVYDGLTQHKPGLAVRSDGSCVAAIPVGPGLFIESRDFTAIPVDVDEPAGVVGTFDLAPRHVRVQVFGGAGFRMGAGPKNDDLSVPYSGVFCTLGPDDVARKIADARGLGVPLFAYVDGRVYPASLVPMADGIEVIPTIQAYPLRPHRSSPMEPIAESVDDIADTIEAMRARWSRVAVVMALYRQIDGDGRYNWPLQHVLDLQAEVWRLVCRYGVTDVLIFHENRANGKDGIASRPEFREAERRIKAAAVGRAPSPMPKPQPVPVPAPASRFPRARSLSHA